MQTISNTDESKHSESVSALSFPAHTYLMLRRGLPNLFARHTCDNLESIEDSWLFIPDRTLESTLISQRTFDIGNGQQAPLTGTLHVDKRILVPVCAAGKVSCIVDVPENTTFIVSAADLKNIERIVKSAGHAEISDAVQIAYEFVSRLFDCKQSYAEFAHRLLNFLTDQIDSSYAGLYWKGAKGFHRRWSYGDLQLSDKLPLDVSLETVEIWKEANSQGKAFMPAELVPDEPVFLKTPPSFLFVHRTPNYSDREQWLVVAVPGDISASAIAKTTIIAGLLSSIDDERTTGFSDLVEMFGGLMNKNHKALPLEEAVRQCFKLIDSKMRLRTLCILDNDNSAIKCIRSEHEQLKLEKTKVTKIPELAWKVIESQEPLMLDGSLQTLQGKQEKDRKEVVSSAFFPVIIKDSGTALLSVEFEGGLKRARQHQHIFVLVSKYLGICLSLLKTVTGEPKIVGTQDRETGEAVSMTRLQTLSNLNGGYFHELVEYLSVILGQAEIMEYGLKKADKSITQEGLLQSTERIVRTAGSLARCLEELKKVSTIQPIESGSSISAEQLLSMLPAMLHGYYLTVKDSKNVEIGFQAKTDKNVSFSIPILHIYDFILPLILALMDQAVCSGTISISVGEHFGRPVLRISYPGKLSGKVPLEKLLNRVFRYCKSEKGEDGEILVSSGDARIIFSVCEGGTCRAIYSNVRSHQAVEEFN